MIKKISLVILLVLIVGTFFGSCSDAPSEDVETTSSPPLTNDEKLLTEEITQNNTLLNEPEEPPIFIETIAFELKHQIIHGRLKDFLNKYPDDNESAHAINIGGTGSYYFILPVADNYLRDIQQHIDNAYFLLTEGRLPSEVQSRPLDKEEVINELEQANVLLSSQILSVDSVYKNDIVQWLKESDRESHIIEKATEEYLYICDDYGDRLSQIFDIIQRLTDELPNAVHK